VGEVASSNLVVPTIYLSSVLSNLWQNPFFCFELYCASSADAFDVDLALNETVQSTFVNNLLEPHCTKFP
jgi:hypothetical protein